MERGNVSLDQDLPQLPRWYGQAPAKEAEKLQGLWEIGEERSQVQRERPQRRQRIRDPQGGAHPREEIDGDGAEREGAAQTKQDVRGGRDTVYDQDPQRGQEGEEVRLQYTLSLLHLISITKENIKSIIG